MNKTNKRYSKSFREKAVKLSYQRDNIKDLANELGIKVQNLYRWRVREQELNHSTVKQKAKKEELIELKRVKKELKDTQLELEILKKAVHNFDFMLRNSLNLISNLSYVWFSSDLDTKSQIISSVIPEKLIFEEKIYRTNDSNSIISLISIDSNVSNKRKTGQNSQNAVKSSWVPTTRLELVSSV